MITLAWVNAQIEETLAGAKTAKNVYDLAMLYIVRNELSKCAAEDPPQAIEQAYASDAGPADPMPQPHDLRAADPYYGQAVYTHGVGTISMEDAQVWVDSLRGADGTRGGRWSLDETRSLAQKRGYTTEMEQVEFWAVINMLHADFCEVAKHYNVSSAEFFADLAKAWINDPDAVDDKAEKYLEWIVQ